MKQLLSHDEIRDLVINAIRKALPQGQSAYARDVYGGPESGKIVYWTEQVSGLIPSGYYEVDWAMDANQQVTLGEPVAVRPATSYVPVKYSALSFEMPKARKVGGVIVASAKIFELGDYPDKDFAMTAADFDDRMLPGFAPVPILIEHQSTPVTADNPFNVGCVRRIWRDGTQVFGELVFNPWVGDAFAGQAPKLSIGIDRASMRLMECSLVETPRVEDAALRESFNAGGQRNGSVMEILELSRKWLRGLLPANRQAEFDTDVVAVSMSASTAPVIATTATATTKPAELAKLEFSQAETALIAALAERFGASIAGVVPPAKVDSAKALYVQLMQTEAAKFGADASLQETAAARGLRELLSALPGVTAELGKEVLSGAKAVAGADVEKPKAPVIDERSTYDRFSGKDGEK